MYYFNSVYTEAEIASQSAKSTDSTVQPHPENQSTVPSHSENKSTVPLQEEVIDLISSESEMSDSDFSLVDLTLDDTENKAVNFEPDQSQDGQPETEAVGVVCQQEDATVSPSPQTAGSVDVRGKKDSKMTKKSKEQDPPR